VKTEYKREAVPAGWLVPISPPELIDGVTNDTRYIRQCEVAIKQCNKDKTDIKGWSDKR